MVRLTGGCSWGCTVPAGERSIVMGYFDEIGYQFWDESNNIAYQLFLK